MRVRTKLILILLVTTLLPFLTVGRIVYQRGKEALRDSLGSSFERMAAEAIDKVDRSLYEVHQNVQTWAGLELMQDVVTGDLDGRISSFLIGVRKEYETFSSIDVLDARGEVVASSEPTFIGRRGADEASVEAAVEGRATVRDVTRDPDTASWIVLFCYPIYAQFDETRTVGAICARWNARELSRMTRAAGARTVAPNADTVLVRNDGLILSTHSTAVGAALSDQMLPRNWLSAIDGTGNGGGYLEGGVEGDGSFLIGYSRSRGYRDFSSLGWSALVLQDLDSAFARVHELEFLFLSTATLVAVVVIVISLTIGHRVTRPLVEMADAAERLAAGDFGARIDYRSGDEIGTLARVFDDMTANLKLQRNQLVDDLARRKRVEAELRLAKESAEESTAKFSAVLNTMSEGIASIDPNGTIVMVNEQVQRIWGYTASELLGRNVDVLVPRFRRGPRPEGPEQRFETESTRKDGTPFSIEVSTAETRIGDRDLITVALRDITERRRAEEQITTALAEKEALLKEIHHRVKNNLQVVVSLLHLQSEHVKDEKAHGIFLDSESRVKSMALMHEKLYRSKDLSSIHVSDYIETLAQNLTRSYSLTSTAVELAVHVEDLVLGMDSAIHCGLLVNELVSNALKHAFPDGRRGCVTVDLREVAAGRYTLVVRDDGIGLPPALDSHSSETLGLQLVHTLAEHLDGTVAFRSGPGTEFEIHFRDVDRSP